MAAWAFACGSSPEAVRGHVRGMLDRAIAESPQQSVRVWAARVGKLGSLGARVWQHP